MADGHVGMLLINLQELRHPTKLESRLLQIQDEYSMLRDSGLLKASEGKFDMFVFVNELKIELERNKIPIFDSYQRDERLDFGVEAMKTRFEEVVKYLDSQKKKQVMKAFETLDSLILSDATVELLYDLGIIKKALDQIHINTDTDYKKEWLRLLSCMSAFESFREYEECTLVLEACIQLLQSKEIAFVELAMWIIANISGDASTHIDIGKKAILTFIDFISNPPTETILQHTLRCITNLFVSSANRKVFDAWGDFSSLVRATSSENLEVQTQAVWCLSHFAAPETSHLFEDQRDLIQNISMFTYMGSVALETSSWRLLANLSLLKGPRKLIIEGKLIDTLQDSIVSHVEDMPENEGKDLTPLLEAIGCFSSLIAKDASLLESVTTPLVKNLAYLLGCVSSEIRMSAAWALAYLTNLEKNQAKLVACSGIDVVLDRIEDGGQERVPCIWVIANLSTNNEFSERIRESDGIHILVKLLFRTTEDERLVVGKALSHLSQNSKNKILLRNLFSKLSQKSNE